MENENFIVCRIEKVNSKSKMSARLNHNYRVESENESLNNVDLERTKDNVLIVGMSKEEAYKYFEEKISYQNQRKNAVYGVEFVLSASPDWFKNGGDLKEFTKRAVELVEKEMGKDNILSAVLHLDETTPHIHFMTMPLKDNKLNFKAFYKNKYAFERLQDRAGLAFADLGLRRGIKKCISKVNHKKYNQYKNEVLEKQTELKDVEEKIEILNNELNNLIVELEKPQKDKKTYAKTAKDILKNLEDLKFTDFIFKKEEFIEAIKRLLLNSPVHKELFKAANDKKKIEKENILLKSSVEEYKEKEKNKKDSDLKKYKIHRDTKEENEKLKREILTYKEYFDFVNSSAEAKNIYIKSKNNFTFKHEEEEIIVSNSVAASQSVAIEEKRKRLKI